MVAARCAPAGSRGAAAACRFGRSLGGSRKIKFRQLADFLIEASRIAVLRFVCPLSYAAFPGLHRAPGIASRRHGASRGWPEPRPPGEHRGRNRQCGS